MRWTLPLTVKVLLSYVAVLAAGAVPAWVYAETRLDDRLLRHEAETRASQLQTIASEVAGLQMREVQNRLERSAKFCGCRLSAIRENGDVFYDSAVPESATLSSHKDRPEVMRVLGLSTATAAFDPGLVGIGVGQRRSETTNEELLYVAVRVRGPVEGAAWILRLAVPTAEASIVQSATTVYLRNGLAVSLTVALLFTLLAAIALVRPLRSIKAGALAMADGDYSVNIPTAGEDEMAQVALALKRLATNVRQQMAAAGSGLATATQLIEGLKVPAVIFEQDGNVVAINGAARALLDIEGPTEGAVIGKLAQRKKVRAVYAKAAEEGVPQPLDLGTDSPLWAHIIRRPGTAPYWLLAGGAADAPGFVLPQPSDVRAIALDGLVADALGRVAELLAQYEVTPVIAEGGLPEMLVAEADDRLVDALTHALGVAVRMASEGTRQLEIECETADARVGLHLDVVLEEEDQDVIERFLEPLGGELEIELGEATLWLPRA